MLIIFTFWSICISLSFSYASLNKPCTPSVAQVEPAIAGSPLILNCTYSCHNPIIGPIKWYKNNQEIFSQVFREGPWKNLTDQSRGDNINFGIYKYSAHPQDSGQYSCIKLKKGAPVDVVYSRTTLNVEVSVSPLNSINTQNFWLQWAVDTMDKSSFCIQEGNSIHQLLANNLMGLSIKYTDYVEVPGDKVTQQDWPVYHAESVTGYPKTLFMHRLYPSSTPPKLFH